ncbi:MAG TPA: DedA family protein [Candidatus Limnocylindria bacterium]|nr:DedA family protein [Candidatus Limnocylindria bacterium]
MSLPPIIRDAIRLLFLLILEHQYVLLFFIVAIEEAGIPLPAPTDVVIAFYGYRARGDLPELAQVVLVCALASTAGTLVPYVLARRFGPSVAHRLARWIDFDPAQVDRWTERIHRHGFLAVVIGRLVPGARVVMSLVAGTAEVPVHQFSLAVFVAASIYWTFWVTVGVALGPTFRRLVGPYLAYVVIALPLLVVSFFVYRHLRARRKWSGPPTYPSP